MTNQNYHIRDMGTIFTIHAQVIFDTTKTNLVYTINNSEKL